LLAGAVWDADAVRDDLRSYVVEHLCDPCAVVCVGGCRWAEWRVLLPGRVALAGVWSGRAGCGSRPWLVGLDPA
jgi:hypothetical protein